MRSVGGSDPYSGAGSKDSLQMGLMHSVVLDAFVVFDWGAIQCRFPADSGFSSTSSEGAKTRIRSSMEALLEWKVLLFFLEFNRQSARCGSPFDWIPRSWILPNL